MKKWYRLGDFHVKFSHEAWSYYCCANCVNLSSNLNFSFSLQWLNFGYMELTKTETKGAHLIEGVAKVLQMIYIPALTNYMSWGGLPSLQVPNS